MRLLVSIAVLAVLGIATPVHAGGGSSGSSSSETGSSSSDAGSSSDTGSTSESSSSDTTGTDATGTTTESTSSTDETTSDTSGGVVDDTTGGGCSCATGDESIVIDMPADGAMVDAPFLVIVDDVPRCPCFDCSCPAEDFEYAQLFVDTLAWGGPCYASPCEWEVTATLGSHELYASAAYPSGEASTSIDVFVTSVDPGTTGDPTTDPTTAPPGSDSSTSGFAGETPPSNGCGCAADAPRTRVLASALLLVLGARRRRRS